MQNTSSNSRHPTQNGQPNKNNNRHNSNHSAKKNNSYKSHQSSLEKITAPYNFVPLAEKVVLPEWANQVSLDQPFADGISGVLDYEIEALTDILVSKEREQKDDKKDNNARFFTADGKEAIPGTSVKGMIRNVLEIASFGKLKTDNKRYSLRDFQVSAYNDVLRNNVKAGFLKYQGGKWLLEPCEMARIDHAEIEGFFGLKKFEFHKIKKVSERYQRLGLLNKPLKSYNFKLEEGKAKFFTAENHQKTGQLVFVGQVNTEKGSDYSTYKGKGLPKKQEYVFFKTIHPQVIELDDADVRDFMFIHAAEKKTNKKQQEDKTKEKKDTPWSFWQAFKTEAIPVFYVQQDDGAYRLGLSRLFRLGYKHTIHDLLLNSCTLNLSEQPDLSELIFGNINNETTALKGRVSFGLARLTHKFPANKPQGHKLVLSNPNPTFYPSYLEQSHAKGKLQGEYHTYMSDEAKLRGWKRYPVSDLRPADAISDADNQQKNNGSLNSILHPLGAKSRFKGKIRFHNLKAVELGALLWAIQLEQGLSHSIGMGKPFGYGQIRIHLAENITFADASNQQHTSPDLIQRFKDYMTEQLGSKWQDSEQIHQLLAMMNPVEGNQAEKAGKLRYLPLADHAKAKGANKNQKLVLEPFKPLVHSKPANSNSPQPKKQWTGNQAKIVNNPMKELLKKAKK